MGLRRDRERVRLGAHRLLRDRRLEGESALAAGLGATALAGGVSADARGGFPDRLRARRRARVPGEVQRDDAGSERRGAALLASLDWSIQVTCGAGGGSGRGGPWMAVAPPRRWGPGRCC